MHNHIQTNHGWRKEAAEAVRRGLGDSDEWEGGGGQGGGWRYMYKAEQKTLCPYVLALTEC